MPHIRLAGIGLVKLHVVVAVSYTHLDVYKRQRKARLIKFLPNGGVEFFFGDVAVPTLEREAVSYTHLKLNFRNALCKKF